MLLSSPTFGAGPSFSGAANVATSYVSPIVVNELMYDPAQPTAAETAAGYTDAEDFEYLELYNRSATTQSLANYYLGNGVGFTFGWYGDGVSGESDTLEGGATATWSTSALAAGTYTVYADYSLTDPDGNARLANPAAQYTITYPGGSKTVTIDQGTAVNGQLDLGLLTTTGAGQVQVELTRGATATSDEWTIANQVEFVASGVDLKVGSPALNSFSMQSGLTTLAPGAYIVLVSDYAAFNFRYNIAANHIPVAGVYSGHQSNSGELIALYDAGPANPTTGFLPYYQTDVVEYSNAAPWPTQAAGAGPSLIRLRPADYGNDSDNWMASNTGGTPGATNIAYDPLSPTVPTSLAATANASSNQIALTWTASTDTRSDVDHYVIYRNGVSIGTSPTPAFTDATVQTAINYTYTVSAVNRDGVESAQSASIVAALPGIASYDWIDGNDIELYFNQPLTAASAGALANYSITAAGISGIAFTGIAVSLDNTKVTLTTNDALSSNSSFTITMHNLATASGNQLPSTFQLSGTFQLPTGSILDQVWDNLDGGNAVSDLTNPALNPNYPNNPTSTNYLTSFEAPQSGISDYGQRVQGYLYAPVTGNYNFWIASDDQSQLWLSTSANPNNAVMIANVTSATSFEQWTAQANQESSAISLVAGQRYYIEALMKQGGGADNLSVAWSYNATNNTTTGTTPFVIAGQYLAPYGGNLDLAPPAAPTNLQAKITGSNNQVTLNWAPVADLTSGIGQYVIYRNGQSYATSTTTSYVDTSISPQTLYTYQVAAVNFDGIQGQQSAAVNVAAVGIGSVATLNSTTVAVQFTEPVDPASSQVVGNYQIPGITVSTAALQSDGITVLLTTSNLGSSSHTLSVSNLHTREGIALSTLSGTFTNVTAGWAVTVYQSNGISMGSVENAQTLINTPSDQILPLTTVNAQFINYATGGAGEGHFTADSALPGQSSVSNNVSNYAITATGAIFIPAAGTYTFDGNTDDGFLLTITGATFTSGTNDTSVGGSSFEYNNSRGAADTLGVANFSAAGYYPISLIFFQGGGPSGVEISAALGSQTAFNSALFHLIGDTANGGLAMGGTYAPAPFTVGVNPLTTNAASPALTGTVSSPTANVTVRVNGVYYAVTNNNGAWTLPAGDIQPPLANGTYDVEVKASNSAGQLAFNTTTNQLIVNTAGPSVQITPVNPSTITTPLASIAIQFSKPVNGFSLQNLQLTLNGLSSPLAGATLSTTDNQNWTLGNLSALNVSQGTYQLTVNPQGWGVADNSGTPLAGNATTSWTVVSATPSPPTNLTGTPGDTTATLQWTASPGATSYNIYRATSTGQETLLHLGVAITSFPDTGLTDGTTYFYEVTAVNAMGESSPSSEVMVTPHVLPPAPPTNLGATAGDTTATLQWTAAPGATSYNIYRATSTGQETLLHSGVMATSFPDSGLTDGTAYFYEVTSVGTAGEGAKSSEVTVTPHVLPPPAPTNLSATPGDTIATLQWTAAPGATSYNIYRGTSTGQETLLHSGVMATSFPDSGLTDGTTYYYEVTAVDSGGEGVRSSEVTATPHVLPPAAPTNVSATPGDTIAALQWTAAQGATSYNIYRGTSTNQETLLHSGVSITSFGDTGLTDGTTYFYEVTAVNAGGESARSSEVTAVPHVVPPATPANVAAAPGNGQVGLSWTASSGAVSYNVYRSTSTGNEVLYHQGVVGNSFNDTGLTNGVAYFYQVSAVNGAGESSRSPQVSAIPVLLPAAPSSLVATTLNTAQIGLQWHESSTSLTGFQVLRSTDGVNFSVLTTLDPTATSYVDSGNLVSGTTYYYQVEAMNSGGSSAPSNTAHAAVVSQVAPGWTDANIGGPALAGTASLNGGVFTVSGGGSNIWYSADQFNYVYQTLNGNGTIVAQVLTQGNTNPWAMAGVMIRNSVSDKGSTFADMVITPGNGAAFQYRAAADTSNLGNNQAAGSVTDWVKLTRSGQTITGYVSINGVDWTQAGSYTFAAGALGSQVYIGLAVSAWNNNSISTATFSNVSITGEALPATPTNFTANSASNTSAALAWQNSDSSVFNYYVYRENPGDSSYTMIATLPGNVTNLTDTGLTSGATYAYQVVAVNSAGDSTPASASVTLPVAGGGAAENNVQLGSGDSGTLDLAGSVSVFTSSTNIINNSTAADGILVTGTNQVVGDISGAGNLVIAAGGDLTANSIVQNSLVIGAGATLTIAPSGGSTDAAAAAANADAANAATTSTLSQTAMARLAAVRAARLAANSALTGDAGGSVVADAAPAAMPVAISTNGATPATSAALAVAAPQSNAAVTDAVVPAVATTAVVVSTEIPVVAPAAMPSAALTVSPSSLISQPAASVAVAPTAAAPTAAAPVASDPTTAIISDSIAIRPTAPIESVAQLVARTEISFAIPDSMRIDAGKTRDSFADPSGPAPSIGAKDGTIASSYVTVVNSLPVTPLGSGGEGIIGGENPTDVVDPSSVRAATDAVFADGEIVDGRVDDEVLSLLAGAACDR